jgi:hypothetical protein
VSVERVGSLGASLSVSGGSLRLGLVLLLDTCVGRHELLPTPLRGSTRHVQAPRKILIEVLNLSKGEIYSNYSLRICP